MLSLLAFAPSDVSKPSPRHDAVRCEILNQEAEFVEDVFKRHPVHRRRDVIVNPVIKGQGEVALLPQQQPADEKIVEDEGAQKNGPTNVKGRDARREFHRATVYSRSFESVVREKRAGL